MFTAIAFTKFLSADFLIEKTKKRMHMKKNNDFLDLFLLVTVARGTLD